MELKMTRVRFASLSWWQSFAIKTREEGIRCVMCKLASYVCLLTHSHQPEDALPKPKIHQAEVQMWQLLAAVGFSESVVTFFMSHVLQRVVAKWIAEILLINSGLVAWKLPGPLQSRKDFLSVEHLINTGFRSLICRHMRLRKKGQLLVMFDLWNAHLIILDLPFSLRSLC